VGRLEREHLDPERLVNLRTRLDLCEEGRHRVGKQTADDPRKACGQQRHRLFNHFHFYPLTVNQSKSLESFASFCHVFIGLIIRRVCDEDT